MAGILKTYVLEGPGGILSIKPCASSPPRLVSGTTATPSGDWIPAPGRTQYLKGELVMELGRPFGGSFSRTFTHFCEFSSC